MKKALLWLLAIPAICCILLLSGCASVKITKPADETVVHSTPLCSIITGMDYPRGFPSGRNNH